MTGFIAIPAPHVPFGPEGVPQYQADSDYLRAAAQKIDAGYSPGGHNVTATVVRTLHDVADALLAARLPSDEELREHAIRVATDETTPGIGFHREGWCRPGDRASGPWVRHGTFSEVEVCDTCGREVGK